jgi:hypothetical protein
VTWSYKVGKDWVWYHPKSNTFTAVGWGRNRNRGDFKTPLGPGGHEISWDEARGYFSSYADAKAVVVERKVGAHVPFAGFGTNLVTVAHSLLLLCLQKRMMKGMSSKAVARAAVKTNQQHGTRTHKGEARQRQCLGDNCQLETSCGPAGPAQSKGSSRDLLGAHRPAACSTRILHTRLQQLPVLSAATAGGDGGSRSAGAGTLPGGDVSGKVGQSQPAQLLNCHMPIG